MVGECNQVSPIAASIPEERIIQSRAECPYLLPDVQVIRRRVNRESGAFGLLKVC